MVEITLLPTELTDAERQALIARLDADECARLARFVRPADGDRFLVARSALRSALARHLNVPAQSLRFDRGAHGKPVLADAQQDTSRPIYFNVSHAGAWVALALADSEVGVDVEAIRPLDTDALAAHLFDETICAELAHARDPAARFFEYWTRCEALAKAQGQGLAQFVDAQRRVAPEALAHVAAFAVAPDYRGAVCALNPQGVPTPVIPHILYRSAPSMLTGSWT